MSRVGLVIRHSDWKEDFTGRNVFLEGESFKEKNNNIVKHLSAHTKGFVHNSTITVVGEMNALIHNLDGYANTHRNVIIDRWEQRNLVILNYGV